MIETIDAGPKQVSRRAIVNAPAAVIFELVANPHRHHELDGSGTVGANISGPNRLSTGDEFSTHMKQFGMKYKTTSAATLVEEDATVEWQLGLGQKWRWELRVLGPDTTEVTETWDIRDIPSFAAIAFKASGMYGRNGRGIEETLHKLQQRFGE